MLVFMHVNMIASSSGKTMLRLMFVQYAILHDGSLKRRV